jgi:hypothetical protein
MYSEGNGEEGEGGVNANGVHERSERATRWERADGQALLHPGTHRGCSGGLGISQWARIRSR